MLDLKLTHANQGASMTSPEHIELLFMNLSELVA